MTDMRELLLDRKQMVTSFQYGKHFLVEMRETHNYGKKVIVPVMYRLSLRNGNTLYIKKEHLKNPMVSTGSEWDVGSWLVVLPTREKNANGLVLNELNYISNLCSGVDDRTGEPVGDMDKLKKRLVTKGVEIFFTPCHICGTLEDLTISDDNQVICHKCKENCLC